MRQLPGSIFGPLRVNESDVARRLQKKTTRFNLFTYLKVSVVKKDLSYPRKAHMEFEKMHGWKTFSFLLRVP